jgi:hypothetical protein
MSKYDEMKLEYDEMKLELTTMQEDEWADFHDKERLFLETEICRLKLENEKLKKRKRVLWKMLVEFMEADFDRRTENK